MNGPCIPPVLGGLTRSMRNGILNVLKPAPMKKSTDDGDGHV